MNDSYQPAIKEKTMTKKYNQRKYDDNDQAKYSGWKPIINVIVCDAVEE